jgi:hypothetical protein
MANYLKGIGDAATRVNEILPSLDARINKFLVGHTAGIIRGEYNEFSAQIVDRGVAVRSGFLTAHGYFGASDTETQINFVMPTGTQYVHIYAEIDLAPIPNTFGIKATAMSNSEAWSPRQDNLLTMQSGKYQFPLYKATVTASTIILTDNRTFIEKPLRAINADNAGVAGTANALSASLNATIDGTYLKVRRLLAADTAYNAKPLSDNATYTIQTPTDAANTIIVQGMLTCANKYWVTLTLHRGSFLSYAQDSPTLYWFRSVNGQVNTSYGFISLEASLSGNTLYISGWKINQANNAYGSSHERASACSFAMHSVFEIQNTNK